MTMTDVQPPHERTLSYYVDVLKRRTDEASRVLDAERLAISPQCGFASTMGGNPLTEADERAKLKLCVNASRAIWR